MDASRDAVNGQYSKKAKYARSAHKGPIDGSKLPKKFSNWSPSPAPTITAEPRIQQASHHQEVRALNHDIDQALRQAGYNTAPPRHGNHVPSNINPLRTYENIAGIEAAVLQAQILRNATDSFEPTFGFELEFIIVYDPSVHVDNRRRTWRMNVEPSEEHEEHALKVYAPYSHTLLYEAIKKFSSRPDQTTVPLHDPEEYDDSVEGFKDYQKWSMTTDGSVGLTSKEAYRSIRLGQTEESVEIVSRVFKTGSDEWRKELQTVLTAIRSLNSKTMQVLVNSTCGFHIHVGDGKKGIAPDTQRRLCLLYTAFQRQIECLHSSTRFAHPDTSLTSALCTSEWDQNRVYNVGTAEILRDQCYSVRMGLEKLRSRPRRELAEYMSQGRKKSTTLNLHDNSKSGELMNPTAVAKEHIRTVEFRQHRGTLFFEEIEAWTLFTTQLIRYAHNSADNVIDRLIWNQFGNLEYSVHDFLRDTGMEHRVRDFYKEKCMRKRVAGDIEGGGARGRMQPQAGFNPGLMTVVDRDYKLGNSWEAVSLAVAEKMKSDCYGIYRGYHNEDVSQPGDRDDEGNFFVPEWLKIESKSKKMR